MFFVPQYLIFPFLFCATKGGSLMFFIALGQWVIGQGRLSERVLKFFHK